MSTYFDAKTFLGDAFDLVIKNLSETGKKYEKDITNDKAFQRFMIDFALVIEQTIKVTVDKHEVTEKIQKVETEMLDMKQRFIEAHELKNDPAIY